MFQGLIQRRRYSLVFIHKKPVKTRIAADPERSGGCGLTGICDKLSHTLCDCKGEIERQAERQRHRDMETEIKGTELTVMDRTLFQVFSVIDVHCFSLQEVLACSNPAQLGRSGCRAHVVLFSFDLSTPTIIL